MKAFLDAKFGTIKFCLTINLKSRNVMLIIRMLLTNSFQMTICIIKKMDLLDFPTIQLLAMNI